MDERLTRIEEKLVFVERHVEELDGVVREAHEAIAALRREIGDLRESTARRIDDLAATDEADDGARVG